MISKVYKQGNVDDRIPVDQGAKGKSKTKPRYESRKIVLTLELGSRLDWKKRYFRVATIN